MSLTHHGSVFQLQFSDADGKEQKEVDHDDPPLLHLTYDYGWACGWLISPVNYCFPMHKLNGTGNDDQIIWVCDPGSFLDDLRYHGEGLRVWATSGYGQYSHFPNRCYYHRKRLSCWARMLHKCHTPSRTRNHQ